MKARGKIGVFVVIPVIVLAAAFITISPKPDLDLSGEEAPLGDISLPPRSVKATMYMDGGSIWVRFLDAGGKPFDFAFPFDYHAGAGTAYPKSYHGASHAVKPGALAFDDSKRAKETVLRLMDRYMDQGDSMTVGSYYMLAEREPPLTVRMYHGIRSELK